MFVLGMLAGAAILFMVAVIASNAREEGIEEGKQLSKKCCNKDCK